MASSVHAFSDAERSAFVRHINDSLASIVELEHLLPLDPNTDSIFHSVHDGTLLTFLINSAVPESVEVQKLHIRPHGHRATFLKLENHRRCLDGARRIGCQLVNISAEDLLEGKPYLVFGLIWQIIRAGLVYHVNFSEHPELMRLLESGEDTKKIPPEAILLRWFNWHLEQSGYKRSVRNFGADLTDCSAYLHLLHALDPKLVTRDAMESCLAESDARQRAQCMLTLATRISAGCGKFLRPEDVLAGCEKLNLCFVASLFSSGTGMAQLHEELEQTNRQLMDRCHHLDGDNQALRKQIADLMDRVRQLEDENFELRSRVGKQRDELVVAIHEKTVAYKDMDTVSRAWDQEKQELERRLNILQSEVGEKEVQLSRVQRDLVTERRQAETFGVCADTLSEELESFRSKQEKMEYLIEHLKTERERSDIQVSLLRTLYKSFPTTESLCKALFCHSLDLKSDRTPKKLTFEMLAPHCDKSGYLTKKARDSNNWRIRYVLVRSNFLFYFKNDTDPHGEPRGCIRLDDAIIYDAENPTKTELKGMAFMCVEVPDHGHVKDIHAGKKLAFYLAGSASDLDSWKMVLKKAAGWWTRKSSVASVRNEFRRRTSTGHGSHHSNDRFSLTSR